MVPVAPPAGDVAFGVVFALFVGALAVLAFLAIRWGVRRDRAGMEAWKQRRLEAASAETDASAKRGATPARPRDRR